MGYTIDFKSLGNVSHHLVIDGGGDPLVGAKDVVVIEEDDSVDFFTPIRTQSGYINIIDTTGSVWENLVPQNALSKKITIDSKIYFIKPETYGNAFCYAPKECSIPIQCPLTVLRSLSLDINPQTIWNTLPTFTQLINTIFAKLNTAAGTSISVTIQDPTPSTLQASGFSFLDLQVQYANLIEVDQDNNLSMRFNCYELLEKICSFLGLTARYNGYQVYLTCPDVVIPPTSMTAQSFLFADTNSTVEIVQGVHSAKMVVDINADSSVFEIPTSMVTENALDGLAAGYYTLMTYNYPAGQGTTGKSYEIVGIPTEYDIGSFTISSIGGYQMIYVLEFDDDGTSSIDHSGMNAVVQITSTIGSGFGIDGNPAIYLSMTDSFEKVLIKGLIHITGSFFRMTFDSERYLEQNIEDGVIMAQLNIGNYYYNGKEWVDASSLSVKPFFELCVHEGNIGSGVSYISSFIHGGDGPVDIANFHSGYQINVPGMLVGQMSFKLIGAMVTGRTNSQLEYANSCTRNLRIEYKRGDFHTQTSYTKSAGGGTSNGFTEDVTIDSIFATDGMRIGAGKGLLIYNGNYYQGSRTDSNSTPEGRTVNRITAYGSTTHRVLTLNLRNGDPIAAELQPTLKITYDGKDYVPISISHNYADNIVTAKLMSLD